MVAAICARIRQQAIGLSQEKCNLAPCLEE